MTALILASLLLPQPLRLETADVEIQLRDSVVTVEASYNFSHAVDSVRLRTILFEGQRVRITGPPGTGGPSTWRVARGLGVLTVPASEGTSATIRYEVRGTADRIPLFVPTVPSVPGASEVRMAVYGIPLAARLEDGFPRMRREDDGRVVASPEHVPALLHLPPQQGSIATNRVAEAAVLVLLLAGTAAWAVKRHYRVAGQP